MSAVLTGSHIVFLIPPRLLPATNDTANSNALPTQNRGFGGLTKSGFPSRSSRPTCSIYHSPELLVGTRRSLFVCLRGIL